MGKVLPLADGTTDATPPPFERVAIVGYGLIGGSLGLAIKEQWPSTLVIAIDRREVIESAMRRYAADVGGADLILAAGAQLIVLAAPVLTNNRILAELADVVPGEALVTDVGSTKRQTVGAARVLPSRLRFVGGHPLAGAAAGGFEAARPDLFRGRPWILTPDDGSHDALDLGAMLESIGASVQMLDADAHDALVAYISHLPQLVATVLMDVVGEHAGLAGLALAGRGLRDTTRLAASPPDIWRDILATNQDFVGPAIDTLIAALLRLREAAGQQAEIERAFTSAAEWKRRLEEHFTQP